MAQLSLFAPKRPEVRPPDLNYIRKSLNWQLRRLRNAHYLFWSESEIRIQEHRFPELARLLPAEEAEVFIAEFEAELTRLRAVGR